MPDAVIMVASGGAGAGAKAAEGAAALAQIGVLAAASAGILRRGVWDAIKDAKVIYATTPRVCRCRPATTSRLRQSFGGRTNGSESCPRNGMKHH